VYLFRVHRDETCATLAVAKVPQLMMHEEGGAAQNYVVADAGEA
jgi:hypothetical protein